MSEGLMLPLEELMAKRAGSVDPSKFPEEQFDLYSIPAFDKGCHEVVAGSEIGSTKQVVEPNDVLLSKIVPHIRRSWVVGQSNGRRMIASGEWIVFRSNKIAPAYLRHVLVSTPFHAQFMQTVSGVGGSLLRARPAQVAKIRIPLPPLPEQRRIAAILDQADALRAKRREALAQLDDLPQAVFGEMFGDAQTIHERWPVRPLGDMLDFLTSGSRGWAEYYAETGALFLRIQNVCRDELDLTDVAFVSAPDSAEARRTEVREGDVLLSITADLGRTAVIPPGIGKAHINQHLSILRTKAVNPRYLSAFIASPAGQREVMGRNKQGVKAGLNFDDIRSFRIPVPPNSLQQEFVTRADEIGRQLKTHRQSLIVLDSLFASLQHRAFRGEL
ncbi:MAG TPA: restriction endonuclease subunit S [Nitrospira sp.]|nr:restriction endonuclease subunit S [Nitrospira sp.]